MALATVSTAMAAVGSPREPAVALVGAPDGYWARRWGVVEHWAGNAVPRLASINSANSMTAVNVPTTVAGLVYPTAEHYTAASSQYDSLTDNAAVSGADVDTCYPIWVYFDSLGADRTLASKYTSGTNQREWNLEYQTAAQRFVFNVSGNGTALTSVTASTFGAPTTGAWYLVVPFHDAVNNLIGISVNGGPFDTAAHTTGIFDGSAAFIIGAVNAGAAQWWNGRIGPFAYIKSPPLGIATLKTEIRDRLWNGGAGRQWPFG